MKTIRRYLLMGFLFVGCGSFCFAQDDNSSSGLPLFPVQNPSEWREFLSTEAGFAVSMPGIPKAAPMVLDSTPGKVSYQSYGLQVPTAGFLVMYSDLPTYSEKPEVIRMALDASRDSMLSQNDGMKLLSEKEITINDIQAREWLYEYAGKISRQRTVLVKDRLYQVILFTSPDVAFAKGIPSSNPDDQTEYYKATSIKFFGSFKALPRKKIAGRSIDRTQGTTVYGSGSVERGSGIETEGEVDRILREERAANSTFVSGGVLNGKATYLPLPDYPAIAKVARASGEVKIRIIVDEEGRVIAAQPASGHPLLQAAAVKAARNARFTPTRLSDKPVKVTGILLFNFILRRVRTT